MNKQQLQNRTKEFAHRCVNLAMALPVNVLGNHLKGQLIRCSTSVACNYRSACLAQSKAGFIAKLSIVVEEIDETLFWIEFIIDRKLLAQSKVKTLREEAAELAAIFVASRKTARK
jgi:four helix bundle protein